MGSKMLIDASHPEETRVVVLKGNRIEEFDFESAARRQLKGNIYLAKVTRVEPSLQAAFIEYGGNRHGFLAFSEIHPDYYQIPLADRQALLQAEEEEHARENEDEDDEDEGNGRRRSAAAATVTAASAAAAPRGEASAEGGDGEEIAEPEYAEDADGERATTPTPRTTARRPMKTKSPTGMSSTCPIRGDRGRGRRVSRRDGRRRRRHAAARRADGHTHDDPSISEPVEADAEASEPKRTSRPASPSRAADEPTMLEAEAVAPAPHDRPRHAGRTRQWRRGSGRGPGDGPRRIDRR